MEHEIVVFLIHILLYYLWYIIACGLLCKCYKKRAVCKRAAKLETEKGLLRKGKRIKVVQTRKEQKQILQAKIDQYTPKTVMPLW